jgi:hypothetical protein
MKQILLITIILFCFTASFSQSTSNARALDIIIKSNQPIQIFGKHTTSKYLSLSKPFSNHIQNVIKTDSGIFCMIDGTGILYKQYISEGKFHRIDSTKFWGYNLGAFTFTYKSDIYNLGGSGLWRSNGHLRKYNFKAHEWDIVPLNEEVSVISSDKEGLVYYDQLNGKIYSGYSYKINDGIKPNSKGQEYDYKVMSLDLASKEWSYLGDLNSNLIDGINSEYNVAITPMSLLTLSGENLNLWDFKNNKHLELNEDKGVFQTIKRGIDTTLVFYKDNYLYLSRGTNNLDSIKLTIDDFHVVGSIYSTSLVTILKPYRMAIYIFIVALVLIIGYKCLIAYKRSVIRKYEAQALAEKEALDVTIKLFTDPELLLLNLLISNSSKGITTNINDINNFLGFAHMSIDTQKQQRHNLITSINKKYLNKTKRNLIQREKLEFDKRSYVYFIAEDELPSLLKYMPKDV